MTERIPVWIERTSGTPGVDAQGRPRELALGDTLRGTIPSSVLLPRGVIIGDPNGDPLGLQLAPGSLFGSIGQGPPSGLSRAQVIDTILGFVDASVGIDDAGKPIKLDSSGLIDTSMIPPASGEGEANVGANLGSGGGAVYVGKVGVELQFRRIYSANTASLTVTDTTDALTAEVVFSDGMAGASTRIWSSGKIATELAGRLASLVEDASPELGGDLDLADFRIVDGDQELIRWEPAELTPPPRGPRGAALHPRQARDHPNAHQSRRRRRDLLRRGRRRLGEFTPPGRDRWRGHSGHDDVHSYGQHFVDQRPGCPCGGQR